LKIQGNLLDAIAVVLMVQDMVLKLPRLSRQGKHRDSLLVFSENLVSLGGEVADGVFAVVFHFILFLLFIYQR
jgi:hypothetical protein